MAAAHASYYTYRTALGSLTIGTDGSAVTAVALGTQKLAGACEPTPLANRCATELQEYFAGKRTVFDLPLAASGTDFQRRVWAAIEAIPYGQTRTTADVAALIGEPGSARAVGVAVKKNPIAVLIPAHRVVTARGTISGSDRSAELRRACLRLEQGS